MPVPQLQVLMPMGGLGSRFTDAGYTTPKPLIHVDGKEMFLRALDSFTPVENISYIFVIRKDHDDMYNLRHQISELLPEAKIFILDHDTQGPVETSLIAEDAIDDTLPIVVADCDIYFESTAYFETLKQQSVDGMLLTFNSDNPRYSYVEVDDSGKAIRTAEKVVISNNALLGGYYFGSGKLFKELAHDFADHELPEGLKEYYLSHLFNMLIERQGTVAIAPIDVMHIFGTPEELDQYNAREQ